MARDREELARSMRLRESELSMTPKEKRNATSAARLATSLANVKRKICNHNMKRDAVEVAEYAKEREGAKKDSRKEDAEGGKKHDRKEEKKDRKPASKFDDGPVVEREEEVTGKTYSEFLAEQK